ncbi:MAG: DMT family transporter [Alphaproteobacteria bacterium]|nr:DMT family transporter [Alphaproteobacteria bacterium]
MNARRTAIDLPAASLMVTLCAVWGLNQVAAKLVNAGISPLLQAGLRSAVAVLLLWAWSTLRGVRLFERDRSLPAGMLIGLLFAAEFAFLFWGLEYTTASRAVVFLYTAPFWVALGVHLLVPGERLYRAQITGLLAAFAGIVIAFGDGLSLSSGSQLIGDAMVLAAGMLWGSTTIAVKATRLAQISASKTLFYQLGVSAVVLLLLSLLLGERGVFAATPFIWGAFAFQAIIVAFVTYLAWFWLVANYPAGRLSAFTFLTPLFGVIAGALLLDEPLSAGLLVSLVLVGLGIWLVNRPPPAPAKPAT